MNELYCTTVAVVTLSTKETNEKFSCKIVFDFEFSDTYSHTAQGHNTS